MIKKTQHKQNFLLIFLLVFLLIGCNSFVTHLVTTLSRDSLSIYNSYQPIKLFINILSLIFPACLIPLILNNINDLNKTYKYLKICFLLQFIVVIIVSIILLLSSSSITNLIISDAKDYINYTLYFKIIAFSFPFQAIWTFIFTTMICYNKYKQYISIAFIYLISMLLLNYIFIYSNLFSLNLDILGYSLSMLFANIITAIISLVYLFVFTKHEKCFSIKISIKEFKYIVNILLFYIIAALLLIMVYNYIIPNIYEYFETVNADFINILNHISALYFKVLFVPICAFVITTVFKISALYKIVNLEYIEMYLKKCSFFIIFYYTFTTSIIYIYSNKILNFLDRNKNNLILENNVSFIIISLGLLSIFCSITLIYTSYFISCAKSQYIAYSGLFTFLIIVTLLLCVTNNMINLSLNNFLLLSITISIVYSLINICYVKYHSLKLQIKEIDDLFKINKNSTKIITS